MGIKLRDLEPAIVSIETALKHGLGFKVEDSKVIFVPPQSDYDKDTMKIVTKQLLQNGEGVKAIILSTDDVPEIASKAQDWMHQTQQVLMDTLDKLTRLEIIYMKLHPGFTGCFFGKDKCPDDAIMRCNNCIQRKDTKGGVLEGW
jgi:hypothetical protein